MKKKHSKAIQALLKRKKWTHINWVPVESAYKMRLDEPSTATLAKEFNISEAAVERACTDGNWQTKRKAYQIELKERIMKEYGAEQAEILRKQLSLIDGSLSIIAEKIRQAIDKKDVSVLNVIDIDKLIRLRSFVTGGPDSRGEDNSIESFIRMLNSKRVKEFRDYKKAEITVKPVEQIEAGTEPEKTESND